MLYLSHFLISFFISETEKVLLSLRALLSSHKLLSEQDHPVAMETSDLDLTASEMTGSTCQCSNMPLEFIQLWPLFEHLMTKRSWEIMGAWMTEHLTMEELEAFVNFVVQFTSVPAQEIVLYKSLKGNDKQVKNMPVK